MSHPLGEFGPWTPAVEMSDEFMHWIPLGCWGKKLKSIGPKMENSVRNTIESFAKIQKLYINWLPLII